MLPYSPYFQEIKISRIPKPGGRINFVLIFEVEGPSHSNRIFCGKKFHDLGGTSYNHGYENLEPNIESWVFRETSYTVSE